MRGSRVESRRSRPPEKSQQNRLSYQYWSGSHLKITKPPGRHSIMGHHRSTSETGVLLAGQCWPTYSGIWLLSPSSTKKIKVGPLWIKLFGSTLIYCDRKMSHCMSSVIRSHSQCRQLLLKNTIPAGLIKTESRWNEPSINMFVIFSNGVSLWHY